MLRAWVPFAECALAAVGDAAEGHETLGDEWSILERCGKDTIFVREDHSRGEIGRLLRGLLADNTVGGISTSRVGGILIG